MSSPRKSDRPFVKNTHMKKEVSVEEKISFECYKNGLQKLYQIYGEMANVSCVKSIFSDEKLSEMYTLAASKNTDNRIIINMGSCMYPGKTTDNDVIFHSIRNSEKLRKIPFEAMQIDSITNAHLKLKQKKGSIIQSLGCDVTAESLWFLYNPKNSARVRCLALPFDVLDNAIGYVNEDEMMDIAFFEIRDWHNIPDAISDAITLNNHDYLFDILRSSTLDILELA